MRDPIASLALITLLAGASPLALSPAAFAKPEDASGGNTETANKFITDAKKALAGGDANTALIQYKNALRSDPNNADARAELAGLELRLGDGPGAEREARQARADGHDDVKTVPTLLGALLLQGRDNDLLTEFPEAADGPVASDIDRARAVALFRQGKKPEALASIDRAVALKRDSVNLLAKARLTAGAGDAKTSETVLDEALALDPKNIEGLVFKLELRRQAGDKEGALAIANKAVEAGGPKNPAPMLARAGVYVDRNEDAKATEDVNRVLATNPKSPQALYFKALIAARAKDYKTANTVLTQLPDQFVSAFRPAQLLAAGVAAAQGQNERALSQLKAAVTKEPGDILARRMLASLQLDTGNAQEALDTLAQIPEGSRDSQTLQLLSRASLRVGKTNEAVAYLEQANKAQPADSGVATQLALVELQAGKTQAGIAGLEELVKKNPTKVESATLLIEAQLRAQHYDEASKAADDLRKAVPDSPLGAYLAGTVELAKRQPAPARQDFEAALATKGDFIPARFGLADVAMQEKKPDEARSQLEAVLKQDDKNERAMLALAELAVIQQRPQEAQSWIDKAVKNNPNSLTAVLAQANYALAHNDARAAMTAANNAVTLKPDSPEALDALGRAQLASGLGNASVATFHKMADLVPGSSAAQVRLAEAQIKAGDVGGARSTLTKALQASPDDAALVQASIGLAVQDKRYNDALTIAETVHDHHPENPQTLVLVADTQAAIGHAVEAAAAYDAASKQIGQQPGLTDEAKRNAQGTLLVRATASLAAAGQQQKALDQLSDWLAKNPNDTNVKRGQAALLLQVGKLPEATTAYQSLVKEAPEDPVALNNLAWLLQDSKPQEARGYAEKAAQLAPNAGDVLDTLGWMQSRQGDGAKSVETLRRAHTVAPDNPEITFHLASVLASNGKKDEAKGLLQGLVENNPTFPQAGEAKALLQTL